MLARAIKLNTNYREIQRWADHADQADYENMGFDKPVFIQNFPVSTQR